MIRRPPRSTQSRSSAASDVYKRQILMPITTPLVKVNAVRNLKATVILFGDNYDETYKEALRISEERNLCFIHPFDDPEVIAGQGTIAIELEQQVNEPPEAIYVAVGGGGLIAGISIYTVSYTHLTLPTIYSV